MEGTGQRPESENSFRNTMAHIRKVADTLGRHKAEMAAKRTSRAEDVKRSMVEVDITFYVRVWSTVR